MLTFYSYGSRENTGSLIVACVQCRMVEEFSSVCFCIRHETCMLYTLKVPFTQCIQTLVEVYVKYLKIYFEKKKKKNTACLKMFLIYTVNEQETNKSHNWETLQLTKNILITSLI